MKQKAVMCLLALTMIASTPLESVMAATTMGQMEPKTVSITEMVENHKGSAVKDFSNGRIYTTEKNLSDTYNAKEITESGNVTFLQYNSSWDAEHAYKKMKAAGMNVYPDTVVGKIDSNVTYGGDTLGMYDASVKGANGKISITTDNEINGLPTAARNIVESNAEICQVGVAVVDTGIDTSNSVFSGRVLSGYSVTGGSTNDRYGHGTHVASIIANNTPSNVKLIPIKVTDDNGAFTMSGLATALAYISEHSSEINVVNLSLSLNTNDSAQMDAVASYVNTYIDDLYNKGILIVTSAGNVGSDSSFTADQSYPANNDKTIAVSALTKSNGTWQFYNKSASGSAVDFCAPGHNIRGVQASSMGMEEINEASGYKGEYLSLGDGTCIMNGTSQAAAFVTSALCDILSYDTSIPASTQRELLEKYAVKSDISGSSSAKDSKFGLGHPDMSAFAYSTGISNGDGTVRGLVDGWDVKVNNSKGIVEYVKYTGNSDTVSIPSTVTINGRTYQVKVYGSDNVFGGNSTIKNVKVANAVTMSNTTGLTFSGCTSLRSVDNLPKASDYSKVFSDCITMTTVPDIPAGVTKMDQGLYNCQNIRGNINFISPDISSANDIFGGSCADDFTITCPANSTTEKTLLAELAKMAKAGKKKNITVNGKTAESDDTTNTGFTMLYDDASKTVLFKKYTGSSTTVNVPSTVKKAGVTYTVILARSTATNGPFVNNKNIKSVTLPAGIKVEDNDASYMFYGCTGLESAMGIPSVATNASYICYGDTSLKTFPEIPAKVTKMDAAFSNCTNAAGTLAIKSPDVTTASKAFSGLKTLSVTCPANSTTEKTILAELNAMGEAAINMKVNGKSGTQTADALKDYEVSYNENAKTILLKKYNGKNTEITIPATIVKDNVTYTVIIGKSTATSGPFANNKTLKSVILPASIKVEDNDGKYMFYKCSNLEKISCIPTCVTDISYICYEDSSLKTLPEVPENVTKMDYAFYGCTSASGSQTIKADYVTAAKDAYKGDKLTIYCTPGSVTYKTLFGLAKEWTGITIGSSIPQKKYTVTFNYRNKKVNKSGTVKKMTVTEKDKALQPKTPKVRGYALVGWYTKDGKKWNFSKQVSANTTLYAKWRSTKIKTPQITYLKSKKKDQFVVKYKKVADVDGYQVRMSHFKNFQGWQGDKTKKTTDTISLFRPGKTYVKVRAYKKINGKYYFSKWSKVKIVNVKIK